MSRLNSYLLAALVVAAPTVATAVPGGEQSVTRAAIDRVETSSTSSAVGPDGRAAFRTKHLFDGREWSGWGTAPGDVEGAWFSVRFDTMRYLTSLEFVPGHERDGKSYKRCGRPKGFTVVTERESRDFAFGSRRYKQAVSFEPPLAAQEVRFIISGVHGRSTDAGVCLSELRLKQARDPFAAMPGLQDRIDQGLAWLADPVNARRGRGALLAVGRPAVGTLVETLSATPTEAAGPVTDRVIELLGELGARDASPVVARFVHSSRPKTEEAALWTLGALRSPTHFKRIKEWYTRSHAPIRNKAFDALARSGHPDALPTVLLELVEGSEARRRSAEANLHRFGPAARKAVLPLLDSEDRRERAAALRALAYMDTHDAMERLLSGLIDSDSTIVSAAVIGLAGRGGAEAREAVSRYWDSRKVDVRAAVAHALGAFANPEDLETLELMTNDASMSVRVAAARSLAHHGPLARPMLTRLARLGPDGATARAAAEALMKKADATADLVPLLGSRHREVRNLAADALEERPGGETALVQALASEDDAARTGASETIIARGTPMVPAVLEVARRAPDAALPDILYVLGEIGSPAAVPFAARLATEGTDLTIRKAAIDTLSRCGEGERIEPTLLAALDDPAVEVRQAAVKALGEKRVHGAADRLMALIESEVRPVQRAAIGAIGSLRHQAAVDALIAQYTESRTAGQDPAIREDIVVALGRIGGRATLPALIHAMSDRDMRVRRAAEQALE